MSDVNSRPHPVVKKLINDPGDVVDNMIAGLTRRHAGLARVTGWPVVVRGAAGRDADGGAEGTRVTLVSGGGSGHEPAHAGYVGPGMLDAAVLGPVFTSPSTDAVHAAIAAVGSGEGGAGTLLIAKNYTGDRLNFGLAAQMAHAEGHDVDLVIVADDVGLGDASRAGRRGIGGTVLVHKVAGALASSGASLAAVTSGVEAFVAGLGTMGVALGPCHSPGASEPNFTLGDDEIEWGLGIHGEAGHERGTMVTAAQVAERLVGAICDDKGIAFGDRVVVLVNGLGSTPPMELEIVAGEVLARLDDAGIRVERCWAGTFLTSLDMPGVSVSIARVDDSTLELLDADADTLAWVPGRRPAAPPQDMEIDLPDPLGELATGGEAGAGSNAREGARVDASVAAAVERAATALVEAEEYLTKLDQQVGDGDLGVNLSRAATAILDTTDVLASAPDVRGYFRALSQLVRAETGGSSGALYSLLLLGFAEAFEEGVTGVDAASAAPALAAGVASVRELGGAEVGDATMIDALVPASEALTQAAEGPGGATDPRDVARAVIAAAEEGAESTRELVASLGRASYVGERGRGVPDPGAVAVATWLAAALTPEQRS